MSPTAPREDVEATIEAVLNASTDTHDDDLRERFTEALERLGADPMQVHLALDAVQDGLYRQETNRRIETDHGRRRAVQLRLLREQLVGAGSRPIGEPDPRWLHEPPYRGLWPFQEDQSEVFYGRSRLTAELTGHLEACLSETGMSVVTGASGAGKSSLVRAGLIPAVAKGQLPVKGSEDWPVATLAPGAKPLDALAQRLSQISGTDAGSIRNTLATRPDQAYLYARQAVFTHTDGMEPDRRDRVRDSGRLLLFIDQFEELFTLCRDEAQRVAFTNALFSIASGGEERSGVIVIGVRGDFIDRCSAIPAMVPVLRRHSFVVGPPEPEELRQVITGPAAAAGLQLDEGLADDILADLRAASGGGAYTAGALPLLSQTMLSIWQRRDGVRLTRAAYNEVGGVGRAIEAGAEQVYQRLGPPGQPLAAELFRRLTVVDRHGEVSRRRARRSVLLAELPGIVPVLEAFTAARLVVMVGDTVEIAHDVLLRSWKRLDTWLQADRMHRALLTEVADDAAEWLERGKDPSFLYQGARFEAAENTRAAWASNPDTYREWNTGVEAFLDAARRAAQRRKNLRRSVTIALVALLAVSLTAAGIALNLNRIAEAANTELTAERNRLLAEDLSSASAEVAGTDGDLSRLLAVAAWRLDPTAEHENTMLNTAGNPVEYATEAHLDGVSALAYSPGGDLLATTDGQGEVAVWNLQDGSEAARADGLGTSVDALAFGPDGTELAASTSDGVRLLDLADLSERDLLDSPSGPLAFDYGPEGILVATDSEVLTIDPDSGEQSSVTAPDVGSINGLTFSSDLGGFVFSTSEGVWSSENIEADPEQLWTGSDSSSISPGGRYMVEWTDEEIVLVDLEIGRPIRAAGLDEPISGAAVSADGSRIALTVDSEVRHLSTEDMAEAAAFDTGYANPLDFHLSADGSMLAVTGDAGTRVWEFDGTELSTEPVFDEPDLPGRLVRLHPDGESVMIVDVGSYRLYDLATGEEIDVPWDPEVWTPHIGYSPDGQWITRIDGENNTEGDNVSMTLDDFAVILDAESGQEQATIEPVNGESAMLGEDTVAYSPDGELVAAISENTVTVWNLGDGSLVEEQTGSFSSISGLRFSADGERLVLAGEAAPIVWDLAEGELRSMDEPASAFGSFDLSVSMHLSDDGRYVIQTGSTSGITRIWDADTGAHLAALPVFGELQRYAPEPGTVVSLRLDGTGYVTDLSFIEDPYATVCGEADRTLTEAEWSEYLPGLEYGSIDVCG